VRALAIIAFVLVLAAIVHAALKSKAAAKVAAGQLGPSADYYADRTLRTGLATAAWNPWGLAALACSTAGPDRLKNSGACHAFQHTLVRVEDTALKVLPIPGGKQIIDGVASIEGKTVRLVKPVASYVGVKAEDAAAAAYNAAKSGAAAVGGAVASGAHAVGGAAETIYDSTLGRIF
jgi:hypothetical protein